MRNVFIFAFTLISIPGLSQELPFQFENIGPTRGGRVTAVCGVTDEPTTFYMGASGGGLWKTIDSGSHWKNISDGYFASPSIGAIEVYQRNPDIIYVGTGSDGLRSNVIVGKGVYKSTDAGATWEFLGLKDAGQIGAIKVHPKNPDIVYVAAIGHPFKKSKERGVYKSVDGGKSWKNILFLSDSVGAVTLELAPKNPKIVYAGMWRAERKPWTIISGDKTGGIFRSTNSGKDWKKMENGLPRDLIGKIDFAVSEDEPSWIWALVQAPLEEEGLYKSENMGRTWQHIKVPKSIQKDMMYRPFYFTNIDANPQDANQLWTGTKYFSTSTDGGISWSSSTSYPHEDHHDLWINPKNPQLQIVGNDGGAAISVDGGKNWSTEFNQPTAELYSVEVDDNYPYYLYSGQQDNSTIKVPSSRPYADVFESNYDPMMTDIQFWESIGGCETGPVIPKPGNPNIVYANCKGQFSVYDRELGYQANYYIGAESLYGNHPDDISYRFQRVVPMEVSPHDSNTVYYGSQYVHKTINGGLSWQQISPDLTANKPEFRMRSGGPIDEDISGEENFNVLYAIEESPLQKGLIWTGSNDGLIYITKDDGQTWKNVTPKDLPEDGRVSKIHSSSHSPEKAYVVINRDYLGDDTPYVLKTADYGQSWENIGIGLSDEIPARVIAEDTEREGLLFLGTEFGLHISFDDGVSWSQFQNNLPIVPISDLKIFRNNLNIATMGRSFWILKDISALRQLQNLVSKETRLYDPKDTYNDILSIYFRAQEKVGDSIRFRFENQDGITIHDKTLALSNVPEGKFGMRRTQWDLRHYIKVKGEKDFQGPKVSPGKYTVIMESNGISQSHTFEYLIHPNMVKKGITANSLQKQEELSVLMANLMLGVKAEIKQLEENLGSSTSSQTESYSQRLEILQKGDERYDKPKLFEHIEYLYEMITTAPQILGEDAFERAKTLEKQYLEYRNIYY